MPSATFDGASPLRRVSAQFTPTDKGAGIVEYLLLVLFIALALIVALVAFSGALGDAFSGAANSIPN
jgi:Flp pilus assembly pilin Flp